MTTLTARMSAPAVRAYQVFRKLFFSCVEMSSRPRWHAALAGTFALSLLMAVMSVRAYGQNVTFAGAQVTVPTTGLNYPSAVAVDAAGDVFIADYDGAQVLEVTPGGVQTIIPAKGLENPSAVAVDAAGNVIIADAGTGAIVEITPNGVQTTRLAGGSFLPEGVAVDGSDDVFFSDLFGLIGETELPSGLNLASHGWTSTWGVALDATGNLYFTLSSSNQVMKGVKGMYSVADDSFSVILDGFNSPEGIAVDAEDDLFIADTGNNQIVESTADGVRSIVGASGLNQPAGVAVDKWGNVFIADAGNGQVVEVMSQPNFGNVNVCPAGQTTPAPCNRTPTLTFNIPAGTTIGSVSILTTGAANLDFQAEANDTSTTLCSATTYSSATTCTVDVTFAPLAPGQRMGAVQIYDQNNNLLASTNIYGIGVGPLIAFQPGAQSTLGSGFSYPSSVTVDAAGDVFIADGGNNEVKEILAVNGSIPASNPTINILGSGFSGPAGVAVDASGNVYVGDWGNNEVKEILAVNGSIPATNPTINVLGSGFSRPYGVAVDASGNVYVGDYYNSEVKEILAVNGSIPATNPTINVLGSGFSNPSAVAVDASGNVYVADTYNSEVKEILAVNGSIPATNPTINVLGSGFSYPYGVAVDASGNVYVADDANSEVKEILAVNGSIPATNPMINVLGSGFIFPEVVALDAHGNVYVADTFNSRIEEINVANPPSLSFASTAVGSTSTDSPQSVTIQNIGNTALTGSGVLSDTTDFTQVTGPGIVPDCTLSTLSLAPGAECNFSLSFTPQAGGPLTSTAVFTDNALNATSATQSITLSGTGINAQTITFTTNTPASAVYNSQFTVAASGGASGNPVTFTSSGVCSNVGATYTMTSGTGTCSVIANQAGNTDYAAAPQVTQPVTATLASQTLSFTSVFGVVAYASQFTVAASATSGLPVAFASGGACTNSGATYTMTGIGECTVAASQAGNMDYAAAPQVFHYGDVIPASQTITVTTNPPASAVFNSSFTVAATATSGLAVTYSSQGVCTNSGPTYTMASVNGECIVVVTQGGNTDYEAVNIHLPVFSLRFSQTITFTTNPPASAVFNSSFTVAATATSGLAVTFASSGACTNSGATYTMTSGAGTCVVFANQTGSPIYQGAPTVTQPVTAAVATANVCRSGQTTPAPCNQSFTVSFNIPAGTTIGSVSILATGAPNLDFQAEVNDTSTTLCTAGTYPAAPSCTVDVTFAPLAPGLRRGAVQLVDASGNIIVSTQIYGVGQGPAVAFGPGTQTTVGSGISKPWGLAVDAAGNVYSSNNTNGQVFKITPGGVQTAVGAIGDNVLGLAVDGAGDVLSANWNIPAVVIIPPGCITTACQTTVPVTGLNGTDGVAIDGVGDVFITEYLNNQVVEVTPSGVQTTVPATGLNGPIALAVDSAGDLFIADNGNNRVVEISINGVQTVVPATGLKTPAGVAVDAAGDVFISDGGNNRVVEVTPDGVQTALTVAGELNTPVNLAVDATGNIFIADNGNNRIVKLRRSQASLSFASTVVGVTSADSPQSVIIQNIGNQPLDAVANGLVVTGPNFVKVPGSGTPQDCAGSFALTPGATCNLSLSFEPQAGGPLTSSAVFTDNALNASSASQSIALSGTGTGAQRQTIAFTTNAPARAAENSLFTVKAKASSGLTVAYTSSGSCTNSGAAYTMTSTAGTCSVIANQAGNSNYSAAPAVTESVSATLESQAITFTSNPPASSTYNSTFMVAAGASSGLTVAFTSSGSCTNLGATYTMTSGTGTCSVIANQAGGGNYSPAPAVTHTVNAAAAAQTITFTTNAPASADNLSSFTVAAGASSGLPVAFTSSGACTNVGATYSMTKGTGTCSVIAKQSGNSDYSAAPTVTETSSTASASQTTTFTTAAPASAAYNSKFTVAASASSGMTVAFTSSGSCSNSGATYTMTSGTGTCSVIVNQAGNSNYSAAPTVTETVNAISTPQTITFNNTAPASKVYLGSFTVAAKASSSLAVAFTSSGSCTNSGATYTMTSGTGTCSVIADQAGNGNYLAAPTVTEVVNATPAAQTITFTTLPPSAFDGGGGVFTVAAGATSMLPVTFTSAGACTNVGATYTATSGSGKCSVIANQAGNGNYTAAPTVTKITTVLVEAK